MAKTKSKTRKKTVKKRTPKRRPKRKVRRVKSRKKKRVRGRKKKRVRGRKKKVARRKVRRRTARRRATGGLGGLIRQLEAHHRALSAQHAGLAAEIASVDGAIQAIGAVGPVPRAGRSRGRALRRAPRPGSLKDTIVKVLQLEGKPMGPAQIAAGVVKAGYRTRAKNLPNMVSNTLSKMPQVTKAGRGLYRV